MNNIISLFIILFILYFIYSCYFCDNIENFSNDSVQYLNQIYDLIKDGKLPSTTITGNLNVTGKINSKLNLMSDNDLNINGNIITNGNISSLNNGYISTKGNLWADKIILGGKYVLYTKDDAFAIGRLVENNKIAPALYLNPGSREGMWLIENHPNDSIHYYWWNSGKSGHAGGSNSDGNLQRILKNEGHRKFKAIDSL